MDGVGHINITSSQFFSGVASGGAGIACIGNTSSPVTISDVSFRSDQSSSLDYLHEDVYSDGTCTDQFWYSTTPCDSNCESCPVSKYYNYL